MSPTATSIKQAALAKDDVLRRIQQAAARGEPLRAGDDTVLASGARRHFGTWKAAVSAAGFEIVPFLKWPPEAVVESIRADVRRGLSVRAIDVIARQESLYKAARDRFGSWSAALEAADPSLLATRYARGKSIVLPALAKNESRRRTRSG